MLVNNAGIAMDGFNAEVARRTIEVNFFGPLRVTEALLPLVPEGGTIVHGVERYGRAGRASTPGCARASPIRR